MSDLEHDALRAEIDELRAELTRVEKDRDTWQREARHWRSETERLVAAEQRRISWRLKQALGRTWLRRPDLLEAAKHDAANWDSEKQSLLDEFIAEQYRDQGRDDPGD